MSAESVLVDVLCKAARLSTDQAQEWIAQNGGLPGAFRYLEQLERAAAGLEPGRPRGHRGRFARQTW